MEVFLLVVHLLIALALVGIVLLQPSEGGALGVGQGPGGLSAMMQGRSAASALTRATVWLGVAFFATSISLTLLAKANRTASPLAPTLGGPAAPAGGPSSIPIPEGGLLGPAPKPTPDAAAPAPVPAAPAPAATAPVAPATPAAPAETPSATPSAAAPATPPAQPATP
jgi:preprotein translocase subunit SecG